MFIPHITIRLNSSNASIQQSIPEMLILRTRTAMTIRLIRRAIPPPLHLRVPARKKLKMLKIRLRKIRKMPRKTAKKLLKMPKKQ